MTRHFLRTTIAVSAMAAATAITFTATAAPAQAESVEVKLQDAIDALPIEDEVRDGYDRDLFPTWSDEDGDGCDTRYEILIAEATEDPEVSDDCKLTGGKWKSYYDGKEFTNPSDLDIDHMVPLAEAWDSGARDWNAEDREQYANDLGDDRDLVAVTNSVNREKSDKDPKEWMPPLDEVKCQYLEEWTVVKTRWKLSADQDEVDALKDLSSDCKNTSLTIEYAI